MRKFRNLVVEGLENRSMLAGNVAVSVSGGTLSITGDDLSNGVSVQQLDTDKFFVTGFARFGATTVNGHAGGEVVSGVSQGIHVALNGGDDIFVMSNSKAQRDQMAADFSGGTAGPIPVSPVAPSSSIHPVTTRVHGNFFADGGAGNDGIGYRAEVGTSDANGNTIAGTIQIVGGAGNDRINGNQSIAYDDMLFNMGDGNDSVHANHTRVGDFLYASLGAGKDLFQSNNSKGFHSQIYGDAGNDTLTVDGYQFDQEIILNGGEGDNAITAAYMSGHVGGVSLITGSGRDILNIGPSSTAGTYAINTGAGNDSVHLSHFDVHVGLLTVSLGDGNDDLHVGNTATHDTYFDGGTGDDSYFNDGGNTLGSPTKVNFEHNS